MKDLSQNQIIKIVADLSDVQKNLVILKAYREYFEIFMSEFSYTGDLPLTFDAWINSFLKG